MTQLAKQNNSIGKIIPKMPKTDIAIYDAYKTMKSIGEFTSNNEMNKLVELIGQWGYYLGISENISQKELILNAQFIKENFGKLNLVDIKEAIRLSTTDQLNVDVNPYGKLSPLYIGKILNAYKTKRSTVIVETNQKLLNIENEKSKPMPSKTERKKSIEIILIDAWNIVNTKKETYYDFGDTIYNIIRLNKLVVFNNNIIQQATNYAKRQIAEEKKSSNLKSVINNMPFQKMQDKHDALLRKKSREYVVNNWLSKIKLYDLKKLIPTLIID